MTAEPKNRKRILLFSLLAVLVLAAVILVVVLLLRCGGNGVVNGLVHEPWRSDESAEIELQNLRQGGWMPVDGDDIEAVSSVHQIKPVLLLLFQEYELVDEYTDVNDITAVQMVKFHDRYYACGAVYHFETGTRESGYVFALFSLEMGGGYESKLVFSTDTGNGAGRMFGVRDDALYFAVYLTDEERKGNMTSFPYCVYSMGPDESVVKTDLRATNMAASGFSAYDENGFDPERRDISRFQLISAENEVLATYGTYQELFQREDNILVASAMYGDILYTLFALDPEAVPDNNR